MAAAPKTGPQHLRPAPYDGSSRAFTIGLAPLDPDRWLDVDADLERYLAEKARLAAISPDRILASAPESLDAQRETLALVLSHLDACHGATHKISTTRAEIVPSGRVIELADDGQPPIHLAASMIQEDLVLMAKDDRGWHLAAASLAFPSSWSLTEKFGLSMHEIHGPVPGFGHGTRNAALIERMFDNLRVQRPVVRWNWSIYGDDRLHHPEQSHPGDRRFGEGSIEGHVFLRIERQTLRKLATTGAIVFSIRIYIDPLEALETRPDGAALATSIADQVEAMSIDERTYKGIETDRDRLLARLRGISR